MATRKKREWRNKRRKSLYNLEDCRTGFMYRVDPSMSPERSVSPEKSPLRSPRRSSPQKLPPSNDLSTNDTVFPAPTPISQSLSLEPTSSQAGRDSVELVGSPPSLLQASLDENSKPDPKEEALLSLNATFLGKLQKAGKIKDLKELEEDKEMFEDFKKGMMEDCNSPLAVPPQVESMYLGVQNICRLELEGWEKLQLDRLDEQEPIVRDEEEGPCFIVEEEKEWDRSKRRRINDIRQEMQRRKEPFLNILETPRTIVHKFSSYPSKVVDTPF